MTKIYSFQVHTTTPTTTHTPITQTQTTPVTAVALPKLKLEFTPTELQKLAPHLLQLQGKNLDPQLFEQFLAQNQQSNKS